ncbi:MAG: AarF/UbiB family protein [Planctomycetota bacterium]
MRLTSLAHYQRDTKRFAQIVAVLARHGLAQRLDRLEPDFLKRWLGHEDLSELADLPLGDRIRRACEELGPAFIKVGQVLSTRPDVIPPDIAQSLEALQAGTPPSPQEEIEAIIEEELGAPCRELFLNWNAEPLASASIGQVHRAQLPDGTHVVVKVQHPGIVQKIETDLAILMHLARFLEEHDPEMALYAPVALAQETKRTLLRELDFRRELRNQQAFERNFAGNESVRIPATYPDFSGSRVLTMEYLPGFPVSDRDRILREGLDPGDVALTGARAFLDMVFRDRLFHADPHPGNVLLLPDGSVGLLDFGMVGRLDEDTLDDLVDLLIGFVRSDADTITRAVLRLGSVPGDCDETALRRELTELQEELAGTPFGQLDAAQMLGQFTALIRTHHITLPGPLSLLIKVLVMLDGTSRSLDRDFNLVEILRPYCERAIKRRHSPRAQMQRIWDAGRDWTRLLERLPGTLDDFSRRFLSHAPSVDLQHKGLEVTVERLVSGILCAAMLLGGSIMWALKAPPTILGISVLGFVATAVALLHGIRLLSQLGKRPPH